jgi:hypothetical protein
VEVGEGEEVERARGYIVEGWRLIDNFCQAIILMEHIPSTYDHRSEKAAGPVRSPVHKLRTGRLVIEWVTISESLLLYVFYFIFSFFRIQNSCTRAIEGI